MKKLVSISFVWMFLLTGTLFGEEISPQVNNPFLLPQTSFYLGNSNYSVNLSNADANSTSNLNGNGFNTYGFDLEVNYSKIMNIGAYFRVESQSVDLDQTINSQFATLIGGFTRFFYAPSFLMGQSLMTHLFLRFELGGGPIILHGPSGLVGQAGAYVGFETYFNKWIGLGLSYGQSFEYGKETLISGSPELANKLNEYQNATIWNSGRVVAVFLKTTFF